MRRAGRVCAGRWQSCRSHNVEGSQAHLAQTQSLPGPCSFSVNHPHHPVSTVLHRPSPQLASNSTAAGLVSLPRRQHAQCRRSMTNTHHEESHAMGQGRANESQLQETCTTRHCDAAHTATTKSRLLRQKSHQESTNAPHPSPIVRNRSLLVLQPIMTVSRSSTHSSPANRRASHRRDAFEGCKDNKSAPERRGGRR